MTRRKKVSRKDAKAQRAKDYEKPRIGRMTRIVPAQLIRAIRFIRGSPSLCPSLCVFAPLRESPFFIFLPRFFCYSCPRPFSFPPHAELGKIVPPIPHSLFPGPQVTRR